MPYSFALQFQVNKAKAVKRGQFQCVLLGVRDSPNRVMQLLVASPDPSVGVAASSMYVRVVVTSDAAKDTLRNTCLLYTSPSPRDRG